MTVRVLGEGVGVGGVGGRGRSAWQRRFLWRELFLTLT